jgi:hypothetical protein
LPKSSVAASPAGTVSNSFETAFSKLNIHLSDPDFVTLKIETSPSRSLHLAHMARPDEAEKLFSISQSYQDQSQSIPPESSLKTPNSSRYSHLYLDQPLKFRFETLNVAAVASLSPHLIIPREFSVSDYNPHSLLIY